jgi:hypothetical protein
MWFVKKTILIMLGALALLPAANAAPSRTARVSITDLSPFTIYGSGFASRERVKITVDAKGRVARSVVANEQGAFGARFATVRIDKCTSYVVRAVGTNGSVATKKVIPECAQPAPAGGAVGEEPPPLNPVDPIPKKR